MSAVANVHMKIEGPNGMIAGESRVKDFAGWIELDEWNWAIDRQAPPGTKAAKDESEDRAEAVPSVVSFSKLMDCATTAMLAAMAKGEILDVTISMVEASDEPFVLDVVLENARVTEYSADFKSDDKSASIEESWNIDYRRIHFAYAVGKKKGPQAFLERPAWASTDKSKGQGKGTEEEIRKLVQHMTPGELPALWKRVEALHNEKRLSPKVPEKE